LPSHVSAVSQGRVTQANLTTDICWVVSAHVDPCVHVLDDGTSYLACSISVTAHRALTWTVLVKYVQGRGKIYGVGRAQWMGGACPSSEKSFDFVCLKWRSLVTSESYLYDVHSIYAAKYSRFHRLWTMNQKLEGYLPLLSRPFASRTSEYLIVLDSVAVSHTHAYMTPCSQHSYAIMSNLIRSTSATFWCLWHGVFCCSRKKSSLLIILMDRTRFLRRSGCKNTFNFWLTFALF